jgi:drug/metabolite transporter (DMT)-like permease
METRRASSPAVAGLLSAVFPGLGQVYNRQWGKGAGFLLGLLVLAGILIASVDPQALQKAADAGAPPENIGQLFLLATLILAVAVWSIVDAVLSAKRSMTRCIQKSNGCPGRGGAQP